MADTTTHEGNLVVTRKLTAVGAFTAPANSITDAMIAQAAPAIDPPKLGRRLQITYAQSGGTTSAADQKAMHVVLGASGVLKALKVGQTTANIGGATVTVDLKKNGTTVLTSTVVLDNSYAAFATRAGVFASTAVVAGDVLELFVTAAAGGGTIGKGVFAVLQLDEQPV